MIGNGNLGSNSISSFGGISGYYGTQGALVGVFLDNNVPNGTAPSRLDFSNSGLGVNFTSLSPALNQIFYIGNGVTSSNIFQEFIAPTDAARIFVGITDAFGFNGAPGAFEDNDGSSTIKIGINADPTGAVTDPVPEPATVALFGIGLLGLAGATRRKLKK